MPAGLLEQAMSPEILDQSWRRLKNDHTPWSIEISRDQLQQHLLLHILTCREQVLCGDYKPLPVRQFTQRKPDGRQRILSAQYMQDKLVQRALLSLLENRAEAIFHDDSYAYRPGRSVEMALDKVRERVRIGLDWLVDADIRSFFDSIPHKPLLKKLKVFINDRNAMRLIEKWLASGAHQSSMLTSRRGISQGAILSPLFCNLFLNEFDQQLKRANIPFVRYADDFLLFSSSKQKSFQALDFATKQMEKLGLEIHPEKTRIVRSGSQVVFLGKPLPEPAR